MGIDKHKNLTTEATELRRHAEERLCAKTAERHPLRTKEETQRLVHELEVHQLQLEMQNEELRHARDEKEAVLEKYTDLYDFAPVGYFTLDRNGLILNVNLSGASLLGIHRSRLLGRRYELFVASEARSFFAEFLGKVFASQSKVSCEVTLKREGNQPHFVQLEALAFTTGQECRVAAIDISVRRQLEKKLEILHSELAARAAELEAANLELEAFNYSVAHDLRQPLNAINGYCQVIKELCGDDLDEQCKGYLQGSYEGTLRMNQLIEALLNFSRMGHVEPRRVLIDLSAMAHAVASELKRTEPQRRVTFRIADGIAANADAGLLRVVIDNLLGNAWKYTGIREEAVIEFGTMEVDGKPAYFVRDNGNGFDMANVDKLFLPFRRLPGAEETRGSGIGLATVERVIKRHDGRIWAESEPGKGACFYFTMGTGKKL